ncbi:hypothetical protein M3Y94_00668200 [Aphelenchoides besseyi]|nr:hypothetical protein M3Y94_00668200 [Aphelenchoides besseyi]
MGRYKSPFDLSVLRDLVETLNTTFVQLDVNDRSMYVEALFEEANRFTGVVTWKNTNPTVNVIPETYEAPATEFIAPVDLRWTPSRMPKLSKGQRCRQVLLNEYHTGGTPQSALERLKHEIGPKSMTIATIRKWFCLVQHLDQEQANDSTTSSLQNNICTSPFTN